MNGGPERPRRRADDWRQDSDVALDRGHFYRIAASLGYDPREVESVRMNRSEVTVVVTGRAIRHRMADRED